MSPRNKMILLGALAASGVVLFTQRKKIAALVAGEQQAQMSAAANAVAQGKGLPIGADAVAAPPVALVQTAATTQSVAQIVNTSVTTLAGIAGLALTMMTLTEKKRALNK